MPPSQVVSMSPSVQQSVSTVQAEGEGEGDGEGEGEQYHGASVSRMDHPAEGLQ